VSTPLTNTTLMTRLNALVEEIVDTVVTFDDRLSFAPVTDEGKYTVAFSARYTQLSLTVLVRVIEENTVEISICSTEAVHSEENTVIYSGHLDSHQIRQCVGKTLAEWYGRAIKSHISPPFS
jgi:hypothetical protein